MLRFACPSCKAIYTAVEDKRGHKFACRVCGQRLQVPMAAPARHKTILGSILSLGARRKSRNSGMPAMTASASGPAGSPRLSQSLPIQTVLIDCPACGCRLTVPETPVASGVTCPKCAAFFAPNTTQPGMQTPAAPINLPARPSPVVQASPPPLLTAEVLPSPLRGQRKVAITKKGLIIAASVGGGLLLTALIVLRIVFSSGGPPPGAGPGSASTPSDELGLSAWRLSSQYRKNEVGADREYKGKPVRISGKVQSIKQAGSGATRVDLEHGIECLFDQRHATEIEKIEKLSPRQPITVQGRCEGTGGHGQDGQQIRISNCQLVTPKVVKVALSKVCQDARDQSEFDDKYAARTLEVSGTFAILGQDRPPRFAPPGWTPEWGIDCDDGVIKCSLTGDPRATPAAAEGQAITLQGVPDGHFFFGRGQSVPHLKNCEVIAVQPLGTAQK